MKLRVFGFGFPAVHGSITSPANLGVGDSISDYDAFVFDPASLQQGVAGQDYFRRQREINDLINRKGGIVLCILRPNANINIGVSGADCYGILIEAAPNPVNLVRGSVQAGEGSQVKLVPDAKGALGLYFRILRENLRFAAYLNTSDANVVGVGGTVFAVDSVPHPIAVEFAVGAGRLCFVPAPQGVAGEQVGAAIVRVVEAHFGGPREIEAPAWSVDVPIPGATAHDARIAELEGKREQVESEIGQLRQKRADLLNYRVLLYGYGKSVLEPTVRSAFRLLGFGVPEPDAYAGEWDVELHDPARPSATAIGEVEGSEGVVDVDKYRQLLDYFQAEVLEGLVHKGILIGNGYRLKELDAPERQNQFSAHAQRGAKQNNFCLLPTMELFKAVCAVLEAPEDEGLKIRIRDSIMNGVGLWVFARESAGRPAGAPGVTASASPG